MKDRLKELLNNAYAPITHFEVSSIIIMKDGREFEGVNVEDASTRAGTCAERNAIFSVITAGYKPGSIKEVNIMVNSEKVGAPCFVCRQMLYEYCDLDTPINCYSNDGKLETYTVRELCPHPFGEENL